MAEKEIVDFLRTAGVEFLRFPGDEISVRDAWHPVACGEPTVKSKTLAECRAAWAQICESTGLIDEAEFCVSVGGIEKARWAQVACSTVEDLPFRLCVYEEEPSLIIASSRWTIFGAITTEEHFFYLFVARRENDRWVLMSAEELGRLGHSK